MSMLRCWDPTAPSQQSMLRATRKVFGLPKSEIEIADPLCGKQNLSLINTVSWFWNTVKSSTTMPSHLNNSCLWNPWISHKPIALLILQRMPPKGFPLAISIACCEDIWLHKVWYPDRRGLWTHQVCASDHLWRTKEWKSYTQVEQFKKPKVKQLREGHTIGASIRIGRHRNATGQGWKPRIKPRTRRWQVSNHSSGVAIGNDRIHIRTSIKKARNGSSVVAEICRRPNGINGLSRRM